MSSLLEQRLIDSFASGIEEKRHTTVAMTSNRFVVFKVAGHSAWSGVGCPWQYVRAQHILIRKDEFWLGHDVAYRRWEGRVARKTLEDALRRSEKADKVWMGKA